MNRDSSISPIRILSILKNRHLIMTLVRREVAARYRGSLLEICGLYLLHFLCWQFTHSYLVWYSKLAGVVVVILVVNLHWCFCRSNGLQSIFRVF